MTGTTAIRRHYDCRLIAPQRALTLLTWLAVLTSAFAQAQPVESSTPEPFSPSARWANYLQRTYGPARLGFLAAETLLDHELRQPTCWDTSANSYGQRYARAFDRRLIRNTADLATGILTGEDLRYKNSRSHSVHERIWNALQSSVTAQLPDGRRRPAYTRFFGSAVTEISTAHWTGQPIRTGWVFQAVGWSVLDQMETNLVDEFGPDIRRITERLWKGATRRRTAAARPLVN
jgi:hypothetical protein